MVEHAGCWRPCAGDDTGREHRPLGLMSLCIGSEGRNLFRKLSIYDDYRI
jgi:hypothetical protein